MKKGLENRIRGWFPKEPYLIGTRLKLASENKQPPLMIPPEYTLSATKFAVAYGVFWIALYGSMLFTSLNFEQNPISEFQVTVWVIAGLVVGTIPSLAFTKNQLRRLSREYRITINAKELALLIVPVALLFLISTLILSSIHFSLLTGFSFSFLSWGISFQVTRIILFALFEKKENMRIMESWFGTEFVLVPKPPPKFDCSVAAKQEV